MRTTLTVILYLTLCSVILSTLQSLWVGITDYGRYLQVFPRATGILFPVTLATSVLAGANSVMIWQRRRWALWVNVAIGLVSIVQIEFVGGPRFNGLVVLIACATTTGLPLVLWSTDAAQTTLSSTQVGDDGE